MHHVNITLYFLPLKVMKCVIPHVWARGVGADLPLREQAVHAAPLQRTGSHVCSYILTTMQFDVRGLTGDLVKEEESQRFLMIVITADTP